MTPINPLDLIDFGTIDIEVGDFFGFGSESGRHPRDTVVEA
jgi:hypothetical protein